MTWNPLRTLAGRLVLVTLVAVLISNIIAFAMFANERGASIQRAAETAMAERMAFTYQRLLDAPPSERARLAEALRDFGIRYSVDPAPRVADADISGVGRRVAQAVAARAGANDLRVHAETVHAPSRRWQAYREWRRERRGPHDGDRDHDGEHGGDRDRAPPPNADDAPMVRLTEVTLSAPLGAAWFNASARLPAPRPAPLGLYLSGLVTILIVGAGAVLIARQIGRPLSDLAGAAQALGSGQTNVSAPVRGPEDVRRASTAFNAMAERLGRQLNRQRQMLWALSHDLRTPITALKLRAELIEDDAARQRLLAPIAEMERLTEQALALARAGASEETRLSVDLAEIARTLCGELQDMGVNIAADAPSVVMVDCRPSEIARALRNLAENAAKYGGGGRMRIYRAANGDAVAEISDDGPGVPPALLTRLTEPFFRADAARSDSETGAGLGLAITQAIADGHGGRLELQNREPHGFTAKLVLPG